MKYIRVANEENLNTNSDSALRMGTPSMVEWCMIISVCLMPYTALKTIGPVGPAEILMLIAFLMMTVFSKKQFELNNTFISKYFFSYIVVAFVGTLFNFGRTAIFSSRLSAGANSIIFDALSYLFILLTLYVFEMHEKDENKRIDSEQILYYIVKFNCVIMPILFAVSRFRPTIFGMHLTYYKYFTPLAKNLHHTSMYMLPLSFSTIYIAERRPKFLNKIFYYALSVLFMYLAIQTGSAKASLGVIAGSVVVILYKLHTRNGNLTKNAKYFFLFYGMVALVLIAFNFKKVYQFAFDYFMENDLNQGRQTIWGIAIERWQEAPAFGYGFGSHVTLGDRFWDAHNTFITALLQTGIIGFIIFVIMWIKIITLYSHNGFMLAMAISILVYVSGGDVLRRIPNWSFIIIGYYVIQKIDGYRRVESKEVLEL